MEVCVLTGDLIFFSAIEGVAGAMGHRARQATSADGTADLVIIDAASSGSDFSSLGPLDPLRTAVFIPHVDVAAFASARASGFAHVYRRGALATELPRLVSEYAAAAGSE